MNYEIYGPFKLKKVDKQKNIDRSNAAKKAFWGNIEEREKGLSGACGCYLFCISVAGIYKPYYVGQTTKRTFKKECFESHKMVNYNDSLAKLKKGTPIIFFITKCTDKNKFVKPNRRHKDITFLENHLISLTHERNPDLMNKKDTKFLREMRVPCLLNSPRKKRTNDEKEFEKVWINKRFNNNKSEASGNVKKLEAKPRESKNKIKASRDGLKYSFTDAAEKVLEEHVNKQPLHFKKITEMAIKYGWISTKSKKPESTMYSVLFTEVNSFKERGAQPRFSLEGKGLIGLTKWKGEYTPTNIKVSGKLEILEANCGIEGQESDVKSILLSKVKNNRLHIKQQHNTLFGDTVPNQPKRLVVLFKINGTQRKKMFQEDQEIIIP